MRNTLILLAMGLVSINAWEARGQDPANPQTPSKSGGVAVTPQRQDPQKKVTSAHSDECIEKTDRQVWRETVPWISGPLIALAVLLMAGLFITMAVTKSGLNDQYFRAYALTLIVFAGLFLIVVGWNQDQLAGMMGLLGTLAGYILGDRRSSN